MYICRPVLTCRLADLVNGKNISGQGSNLMREPVCMHAGTQSCAVSGFCTGGTCSCSLHSSANCGSRGGAMCWVCP